ncbi:hypothetical protein NMY22_g16847 [Coprinellus aureogranulatus]|nr:hypothetical protein NMY22_g16847 [Coprinellus aureogranulatus]
MDTPAPGDRLSPEQWHECYHYFGSRVLHAAEFIGRVGRSDRDFIKRNESLIQERLRNEAAWANTVVAIAETRVDLKPTRVIAGFTRLVSSGPLCDEETRDAREEYESFYLSHCTNTAAFPVAAHVWWDKKAIRRTKKALSSFDDVVNSYFKDRSLIYREGALEYLDPVVITPVQELEELLAARQDAEAALALLKIRRAELKQRLIAKERVLTRNPYIAFDDHTGLKRFSALCADTFKKP